MLPIKELLVMAAVMAGGSATAFITQQLYYACLINIPGALTSYHVDDNGVIHTGVPRLQLTNDVITDISVE